MKRYIIIAFYIIPSFLIFAQSYQISFSGSGANNYVDSVKVENLTKGTSLNMWGNDILSLNLSSGIRESKILSEMSVYPNPSSGSFAVTIYSPEIGYIFISLIDMAGKIIFCKEVFAMEGFSSINFKGLTTGCYLLKADMGVRTYYTRILTFNSELSRNSIEMELEKTGVNEYMTSKIQSAVNMDYSLGDRLKLTGKSANFLTVKMLVADKSQTINFVFVACTDVDGINYPVVKIGTQTWMAENLRSIHYANNDEIPNVVDDAWGTLTTGAYCDYDDSAMNGEIYGHLYNYYAVADARNICPAGWHVATDAEWTTLIDFAGGLTVAGGKLKESGFTHWQSPNMDATDEFGFSALPAGFRYNDSYQYIGQNGIYWTVTSGSGDYSWVRNFGYNRANLQRYEGFNPVGWSVRCIKN